MMKFRPINNWVFIKRDPVEKTFLELNISEKALTKNQNGVITHSDNKKNIGKRVHVPHYRIVDYDIDGEEYAVVRGSDLFAVEDDGVYRPVNRYVKVRKCVNDHFRGDDGEIFLYKTDEAVEDTTWVEILDVAEDCELLSREDIGMFCISPESNDRLQRLGYSKDYMLHEELIEFVTGD